MNSCGKAARAPLGFFDSGVGGLSIWRAVVAALPYEATVYVADQAHLPYGPRPLAEIRDYAKGITEFLLDRGAKLIVVACNSASGPALHALRQDFPEVPFVGMEPAVKPAAESTRTGVIGVLATPATFQGELFLQLAERFAAEVQLETQSCPGLVEIVERGELESSETVELLREYLEPLLAQKVDQLVLGCTHYPFLAPTIARIAGPGVTLIDPAPAIARQVERVLARRRLLAEPANAPRHAFYTSADPHALARMLKQLVQVSVVPRALEWIGKTLREPEGH